MPGSNDRAVHIYFGDLVVKTEMESELKEQSLRVSFFSQYIISHLTKDNACICNSFGKN